MLLNFKFFGIFIFQIDPLFIYNSFFLIFIFFCLGLILSFIMIIIPYFFSGRSIKALEKISEYECGFEPFDSATRQPFTIHFYIVGILFLIFDVEIALLFPWSILILNLSWYGFWLMIFFLILLTIGFIYEWKIGAIAWGPVYFNLKN